MNPNKLKRTARAAWPAMLALLLILALSPNAAFAHARVASSTPAEGAGVAPGLTQIVVTFTEDLSIDQSGAELLMSGAAVPGITASVNRADRKEMTVQTPPLAAGKYTLNWKVVTEDDNAQTNGTLNFTVTGATDRPSGNMSTTGGNSGTGGGTSGTGTTPSQPLPSTGRAGASPQDLIAGIAALLLLVGLALKVRARAQAR